MRFARTVYTIAAAYGFMVLFPLYFLIDRMGELAPPAVTHPEAYYGFVGVALLWQLAFLLIASDPVRYRPLMPITILEKLAYIVPVVILFWLGRVGTAVLLTSLADPILGVLFLAAYWRTNSTPLG
jgi:hypothetical protein